MAQINERIARLLTVRIEPGEDAATSWPEQTYFAPSYLAHLIGTAHGAEPKAGAPLAVPVQHLATRLRQRLERYGRGTPVAVVLEARAEALPIDRFYDDLLIELCRVDLLHLRHARMCCVTFIVSRPDVLLDRSVSLQLAAERLRQSDIGVFVVQRDDGSVDPEQGPAQKPGHVLVLHGESSKHPPGHIQSIIADSQDDVPLDTPLRSLGEDIALTLDLEFDHLVVSDGFGAELHVPCLISASRVGEDEGLVKRLRAEVSSFLSTSEWMAGTLEFEDAGLRASLLPQLIEGDAARDADLTENLAGRAVIVLVDIAYDSSRLKAAQTELKRRGAVEVAFLSIVMPQDPIDPDIVVRGLVPLSVVSTRSTENCDFCLLGVPVVSGSGISEVRNKVAQFHPVVFWKLISLSPTFTAAGHFRSSRTGNHFWLRVMMNDVFASFGDSLANRLVRVLQTQAGVFRSWWDNIIVADDPESVALAQAIRRVIGKRAPEIIAVKREVIHGVSSGEFGEPAAEWISTSLEKFGNHRNVIIVDQAAHHLRTFTALKALCDAAGWHTLAFAVVLDRTGFSSEIHHEMHDAHYVWLHSWPFPPRTGVSCTCGSGRQR